MCDGNNFENIKFWDILYIVCFWVYKSKKLYLIKIFDILKLEWEWSCYGV